MGSPPGSGSLRVLLVSHTYVVGVNQAKVAALAKTGLEIGLLVPNRWRDTIRSVSLEVPPEPTLPIFSASIFGSGAGRRYFYPPWQVYRAFRAFRPQVVHVEEEPDSVALLQMALMKRLFAFKLVFFTWENIFRSRLSSILERFNLAASDWAVAGSGQARDVLLRKGFSRPITVLPQLGVDGEEFRPQPAGHLRESLGLSAFTIGYLGRLVAEKGLLLLLEAVAGLKEDYRFLLLGGGPLKERLKARAQELEVDQKVLFLPPLRHEEVPPYLNCLDVLVLPSLTTPQWREQFGHVLIEAMACQVPVVGSDSGAIPEVVGDAGLLFKEGDVVELRRRLERLMEDPSLRAELGRRGRSRVLARFTHRVIAEELAHVYEGVAKT